MTDSTVNAKALVTPPSSSGPVSAPNIVEVARRYRVSPFRQLREMVQLNLGQGRVAQKDYYSLGLYDPAISAEAKRAYVGVKGSHQLNWRLNPSELSRATHFMRDKVLYPSLLTQLGIASTRTQAVAQADRLYGNIPTLSTPEEISGFLRREAAYPIFAKPRNASGSFGSALLTGIDDDMLVLGSGRRVALEAFCREVFTDYPDGFLFQTALRQHPDMAAMTGGVAVGSLRIVTLRDEALPRPLYALWKLPSPKAMSDNFWQEGSMVAAVDDAGRLSRARIGTGLQGRWIAEHPVSGMAFDGFEVPHFHAALDVAARAHAMFPDFGLIGWDIAICADGPVIIEANDSPHHTLYQLAFGQGVRNPGLLPRLEAAIARSDRMRAAKKARPGGRLRSKYHRR
ncbi:sugar-transfer associated ATP-grasp domain-containing protein [Pseudodonghicola flavimaris]|uniref:Sugar-transfer associated ATP-grasp domain-containing protein n=1 Tax=Pseudodonghicola flavimaris TaxID=3050036 RepID=A0ABT7EXF2_9RHOB|nr:sugar-transfer associated ATP-grasp domain-containing protein [Pseudodonghicola flavimaris]MDK3016955.1 sugar-transfer associated ATP-grasp domain-containing protein [Pseudodonghicola flavimaris]